MNEHIHNEEILNLFKEIESSPESTQRSLSQKLNISLGKTNYLIKELAKSGFISIMNFSKGNGKLKKVKYLLTKEGLEYRINATHSFLKAKETEYNKLKQEWERLTVKTN